MIALLNAKKCAGLLLAFIFGCLLLTYQGCKKKRDEMGQILYKHTHNPVLKDASQEDFAMVFKRVLAQNRNSLSNPDLIMKYYHENDYEPVFVMNHLWNGDLRTMISYYKRASEHGLDPAIFNPGQLNDLIEKFYSKDAIKTTGQAYYDIAKLEMLAANSMINYSNDLQFGLVNPKKIFSRYFIATARPDSSSMKHVFAVANVKAYLDSIQPKNPEYLALQKAYLEGFVAPKMSKEETRRILLVNLERLRWKNKPADLRYVYVNIPPGCDRQRKICVGYEGLRG
jgi:L,D-transpeptidase YcbB